MVLSVSSNTLSEKQVNDILKAQFNNIELRRMSQNSGKLYMSYVIAAENFDQLSEVKSSILALDANGEFSFVDNKNMIG